MAGTGHPRFEDAQDISTQTEIPDEGSMAIIGPGGQQVKREFHVIDSPFAIHVGKPLSCLQHLVTCASGIAEVTRVTMNT